MHALWRFGQRKYKRILPCYNGTWKKKIQSPWHLSEREFVLIPGYSVKPAKFMEDMTYDMAGSATGVV